MDEAKRDYIQQWLGKACTDLRSARRLAAPPSPYRVATFQFSCNH
jgi:hypothetical protein